MVSQISSDSTVYLVVSLGKNKQPWWRHQMETFSALLAICAENSPVPGEFPTQRPVTRSFDVYFDLRPDKRLSKQSWGWWFETQSRSLWRHRNESSRYWPFGKEIHRWPRNAFLCHDVIIHTLLVESMYIFVFQLPFLVNFFMEIYVTIINEFQKTTMNCCVFYIFCAGRCIPDLRSAVNSPHKGQWRGALIFSLICVWLNGCINNREAGDLRRYRAHYDVSVIFFYFWVVTSKIWFKCEYIVYDFENNSARSKTINIFTTSNYSN